MSTNNSLVICCQRLTAFAILPGAGLLLWVSTVTEGVKMGFWKACVLFLQAMLIPKIHLAFENLILRQQLAVCKQSG